MRIIFFGSTSDSVIVADKLLHCEIIAVVTQPPKPVGRNALVTATPLEVWAKGKKIPVLSFPQDMEKPWKFASEENVINTIESLKPDLLVTASYGQKIPKELVEKIPFGGLNVHPSLLPRWRGADPIPWAILSGDAQTGVTISTITEKMDDGAIIAQKKHPLTDKDTPDVTRRNLFIIGAELLATSLPDFFAKKMKPIPQKKEDVTTARKLTRDDGYIPWELIHAAMNGIDIPRKKRTAFISTIDDALLPSMLRLFRALHPWPGIWTKIENENATLLGKRVKILSIHEDTGKLILDTVQLEGKKPIDWNTFKKAYFAVNSI